MTLVKSVIFLLLGFYTLHNPVIWGIIFFPWLIASIGKYEQNKKKKKKSDFISCSALNGGET